MTDMSHVQAKLTAITTAHTDYAKAAFEANKAYMEKLATMKAPDQAMQLTSDHMRTAYETFVAEIAEDRRDVQGLLSVGIPAHDRNCCKEPAGGLSESYA